jgi:tetratricopeptide (TPR) repeat protein
MPRLSDPGQLRTVVTGLLGFAAAQEQELLASGRTAEGGSAARWAAAPLVAHNTEFKQQQVQRLTAITTGTAAPEFAEIDHGSAEVYPAYAAIPADRAAQNSWAATGALIGGLAAIADEDLLDPQRHPWLRGRMLWLQIIVRGFWHPTGHLGDYYLARGQAETAVRLARRGVATAADLDAPPPATGMAWYNLACFLSRAGRHDEAASALTEAIALNPDVRANAARDPDLAPLRPTFADLVPAGGLLRNRLARRGFPPCS